MLTDIFIKFNNVKEIHYYMFLLDITIDLSSYT